jgi:colicin import membrane protein
MSPATERLEFAPPPQRGTLRAVLLALLAHALLMAFLTWGVRWRHQAENDAVEAELWFSVAQQTAPLAAAPPPEPVPEPTPEPTPPPPQTVEPPEPAPAPSEPDIALEREKKLKEQQERERELELEREAERKRLEAAKKAEQEKKEAQARQRAEEEAEREKEEQRKLAEQKRRQEAEARQAAADREATLKRMRQMAGAGGQGGAPRPSGPSGSYTGKVQAAVRPNVVFPDADLISGNPAAEFDVRLAPDGTIVGTPDLIKTSGNSSWDQAALRALQKTAKLPRDVDGTVPQRLIISLKPKG